MIRSIATLGLLMATTTANADIAVTFRDGAPKDTFSITNTGTCALPPVSLVIDLEPSPAGLIFDVTESGGGVEVFQPFEVTAGGNLIDAVSTVQDGDQRVQLDLAALPAEGLVQFTIDLDDTIGAREITVSGSEIAGARVVLGREFDSVEGVFDDTGRAVVSLADCVS